MIISQTFNEIYEPLFTTKARYIDLWGGRGRGGSYTGTQYFLHLITKPHYFRGYFVRETFNDIKDSLFQDFKDRIEECENLNIEDFKINENDYSILYKPTGNKIISKGVKKSGQRTAKMKSLAGATHVLIEEADELGEEDFDQMDLSLRTIKAEKIQIIRVFNPPGKEHWIWRDYLLTPAEKPEDYTDKEFLYFTAKPKSDANLCSVFSTYNDNILNIEESTIVKFESFKKKKPEYYFTVIKGLISEGMRGRIYSGWEPITDELFNNIDARSIFGLDFGTTSPAGLVEVKIVKTNLYLREQNYDPMTTKEIAIKLCKLGIVNQVIIADSAEPQNIQKLRTGWTRDELTPDECEKYPQMLKGWNIYGVVKGPGSLAFRINQVKDYNVFLTENSSNFWAEYRNYKWAMDKNKNPTDEPEDNNNHLHDPAGYVVTSKGRYF